LIGALAVLPAMKMMRATNTTTPTTTAVHVALALVPARWWTAGVDSIGAAATGWPVPVVSVSPGRPGRPGRPGWAGWSPSASMSI
jgi:hypothetical protein